MGGGEVKVTGEVRCVLPRPQKHKTRKSITVASWLNWVRCASTATQHTYQHTNEQHFYTSVVATERLDEGEWSTVEEDEEGRVS